MHLEQKDGFHAVVVGGGTATNAIVPVYANVAKTIAYVVPISDNGGSTSEILRHLGGPAIGDARSRVVRLIPHTPIRDLLEFRLPEDEVLAHKEWQSIVEGNHRLWKPVPSHLRNMYRAFIVSVSSEILRRSRPGAEFRFSNASVGNQLLSGARIFFGSLDSAIEFVLRTARASPRYAVLPALSTHFSYHIAAELTNEEVIVGQTQISHPSTDQENAASGEPMVLDGSESEDEDTPEDATIPFSHPSLNSSQISFSKEVNASLPAPIDRVYYVNPYGAEINPETPLRVRKSLRSAQLLVYSIGSLYTSLVPVLILRGFAAAAERVPCKVLILNGYQDRETENMTAYAYVEAIVRACQYSAGLRGHAPADPASWTKYITHVVYGEPNFHHHPSLGANSRLLLTERTQTPLPHSPRRQPLDIDVPALLQCGVKCVPVACDAESREYDPGALGRKLCEIAGSPSFSDSDRGVHSADLLAFAYPNSDF